MTVILLFPDNYILIKLISLANECGDEVNGKERRDDRSIAMFNISDKTEMQD
jgi:hypothetical protein